MTFNNLPFLKDIIKKLIHNVQQKKLAHAQLFWGPAGNGKMALAWAFASYILCKKRSNEQDQEDSCGTCISCRKMQTLTHPDFYCIFPFQADEGSSPLTSFDYMKEFRSYIIQHHGMVDFYSWLLFTHNARNEEKKKLGIINVKTIEQLMEYIELTPAESEYKIILIWLPEYIQYQAAPKLLKILEEPPLNTIFLLVSENKDQILPTILSRLQQWHIPPISTQHILEFLNRHFSNFNREVLISASYFARNNASKAVEYLLYKEQWEFILNFFRNWMRATYQFLPSKLLELTHEFAQFSRDQQKQLIIESSYFISDALKLHFNISPPDTLLLPDREFFEKFSKFVTPEFYFAFVIEADKAIREIERNGNPRLIFLNFCENIRNHFIKPQK
ncbi:MAG: hypothetical protein N2Z72_00680 [Bacteroidales bacterium]|nr:hypothetical protein [Bacteroidales bacterium]